MATCEKMLTFFVRHLLVIFRADGWRFTQFAFSSFLEETEGLLVQRPVSWAGSQPILISFRIEGFIYVFSTLQLSANIELKILRRGPLQERVFPVLICARARTNVM